MSKVIQIVSGGSVVNAIVVAAGAILAPDRLSVSWGAGEEAGVLDAPEGAVFMHVEGAAIGWELDGGTLVPPPAPEEPPIDLVVYAREARWRAEVAGMIWNGLPIATDDSSKLKITGARLAAQANPAFETTWFGTDGEGVVVDAPLIIQLSDAVLAHVDGTFTTFGQVRAAITAGTITTREEIDAAFA